MKISKEDIVLWKNADKVLILNRETGSWFVGEDQYNDIEKCLNGEITLEKAKDCKLVEKLINENILFTDKGKSIIEKPYVDQLGLLILDTTNRCNLACKYCFVNATDSGVMMSLETALKALRAVLDSSKCADVLTIEFSGGEPLLNFSMIEQFIPKANKMAEKKKKKLTFSIQTNATLLNEHIMTFLIENKVNVGVSIDGEKEYHDKNRVFSDGIGSLDVITKNIKEFKNKGGQVSVLAVISSVQQYESVIKYAIENGIESIRTNLVTKIGRAEEKKEFDLEYMELADKFIEVSDKMICGEIKLHDVTLSHFLWNLVQVQPHMCFRVPCGSGRNQISITASGEMYTCQEWRNIHDAPIGNVNVDTDLDMKLIENKRARELANRDVNKSEVCKKCDWKTFCGICPR